MFAKFIDFSKHPCASQVEVVVSMNKVNTNKVCVKTQRCYYHSFVLEESL